MSEISDEDVQTVMTFMKNLSMAGMAPKDVLREGFAYALDVIHYSAYYVDSNRLYFAGSYADYPLTPRLRKQASELFAQTVKRPRVDQAGEEYP
jgi:hypothetical protein